MPHYVYHMLLYDLLHRGLSVRAESPSVVMQIPPTPSPLLEMFGNFPWEFFLEPIFREKYIFLKVMFGIFFTENHFAFAFKYKSSNCRQWRPEHWKATLYDLYSSVKILLVHALLERHLFIRHHDFRKSFEIQQIKNQRNWKKQEISY